MRCFACWFVALICLMGAEARGAWAWGKKPADAGPVFEKGRPGGAYFRREPRVVGFEGHNAVLEFECGATAPATVHYGEIALDDDLPVTRYIARAVEEVKGKPTRLVRKHRVLVNLQSLEGGASRRLKVTGGVVGFRVELADLYGRGARFFEGRFAYRHDGKQKLYRLVPWVIEGPFVDCPTPDGMTVSWRCWPPAYGRVVLDAGLGAPSPSGSVVEHEVRINGLDTDTKYRYRIELSETPGFETAYADAAHEFRTAPPEGSRRRILLGYMCDGRAGHGGELRAYNGVNAYSMQKFTQRMYRDGCEIACFGGDLIDGYVSGIENWTQQMHAYKAAISPAAARMPIFEGMGNHDRFDEWYKITKATPTIETLGASRSSPVPSRSAEHVFAGQFVSPAGSAYGFGPPEPERLAVDGGPAWIGPRYDGTTYSFNYGNLHVVSVNTSYWALDLGGYKMQKPVPDSKWLAWGAALELLGGAREGYIMANQMAWLQKDLAAAEADPNIDHIILFQHEPVFPTAWHVVDSMWFSGWGRGGKPLNSKLTPLSDVIDMRDGFWSLIAGQSKSLVLFAGDEHCYARVRINRHTPVYESGSANPNFTNQVWQIISGGAGAPYHLDNTDVPWAKAGYVEKFDTALHYCVLEVEGPKAAIRVYNETGGLIDQAVLKE